MVHNAACRFRDTARCPSLDSASLLTMIQVACKTGCTLQRFPEPLPHSRIGTCCCSLYRIGCGQARSRSLQFRVYSGGQLFTFNDTVLRGITVLERRYTPSCDFIYFALLIGP